MKRKNAVLLALAMMPIASEVQAGFPSKAEVLGKSCQESLRYAYEGFAKWSYTVKRSWHKGGGLPIDRRASHVTVDLYKDGKYRATCQAYDLQPKGDECWVAWCTGPSGNKPGATRLIPALWNSRGG